MLHEITKLNILINKIDETSILCHDSVIAIRSEKGLHLIDFSYNLRCYDKKLDHLESTITAPKYSPASKWFEERFVRNGMRNSEFIQMILDPTLWPHNNELLNEMSSIVAFEWSPVNFIGNMDSVIAVLTSVGCVELFGPNRLTWTSVLNLSSLVKESLESLSLTKSFNETPKIFKELQEATHALATSAICWANKMNKEHSCYFVTAQKSGCILFWLLKNQDQEVKANVIGFIDAYTVDILFITWVPIDEDIFILITSNVLGTVTANLCKIENNLIKHLSKHDLWQYNDRMIAKHFNYIISNENIILMYSKHRHFVVQVIDKNCNLITQEVSNINDHRITDIKKCINDFYLTTVNNKMYILKIDYSNTVLSINRYLVERKESYPTSDLLGIGFSKNGVLCTLVLIDRKVLWRKEAFKIEVIFLIDSETSNIEFETSILLNNPTKKLTNYWDYIELLRYKVMKTKTLPSLNYQQLLDEGDTDIYKLKMYYILLILYDNLKNQCKNSSQDLLPETSIEIISERIYASHACSIIKNIYKKSQITDFVLHEIESDTLSSAKSFLDYYCKKYKKEIEFLLDPDMLRIIKNNKVYVCQCCDEQIDGFSCRNGHLNQFCSLTFTPIEDNDYLVCKACGSLARIELCPNKPTCLFCDLYLCNYFPT